MGSQRPGEELDFTYCNFGTNASLPRTIHNNGDGTLAVGRIGARLPNTDDRGTWLRW